MHSKWIKFFLLFTFAFWATGAAKYFHELVEHHGGSDACADDDDDCACCAANVAAHSTAANSLLKLSASPQKSPQKHGGDEGCLTCKTLAAMAVEQPIPIAVPALTLDRLSTLAQHDWVPPIVRCEFNQPATGPPMFDLT